MILLLLLARADALWPQLKTPNRPEKRVLIRKVADEMEEATKQPSEGESTDTVCANNTVPSAALCELDGANEATMKPALGQGAL